MSKDKNKAPDAKVPTAKTPPVKPVSVKVAPLFRKIDWLTLGITFVIVWAIYLVMLAPNQTLEDSGELCTGSFYAGIPHPPGYPFWAIYSWVWTVILPFGSVAWRVEVGESFAVAMGCGLLAFMVSRGGSMLIEGIEELKAVTQKWETAICIISGMVAGLLLGLDSFIWKEAVVINRIALFGMPWLVVVLLCLMRWIYAPHQKRYLYLALFFFGICATIHQTLIVAAMGIEVLIAVAHPRLGRDLFLGNSIIYVLGLIAMSTGILPILNSTSPTVLGILHVVGVGSIAAGIWLCVKTKEIGSEWKTVLFMGLLWVAGASFYFYEPISGMTNPPMEWGYPRTVEGFFHALTRGQYEKVTATNILQDPMRFVGELGMLVREIAESFNWVYILIALLPFLFLFKMQKRERAWIIGLTAIYLCLAVLLVILLQLTPDRQSSDETKVFFCASHAIVAMMIGYGLTLTAAYMATHYGKFRRWGLLGGGIAAILALYCLVGATGRLYFGPAGQLRISWLPDWVGQAFNFGPDGQFTLAEFPHWICQAFVRDQYGSPVFANLILIALPVIFIGALLVYRNRGPVLILLCLFATMPLYSGLAHWYKSEQRNHWFGYWFGHDMFTPPFGIYPEMTRNSILFGGTDPGRFCPTYMIFCESFIPPRCKPMDPNFDRRDVYIITQNALADNTYLEYIRAQYFRSSQNALGLDTPFFRDFVRLFGNNAVIRALSNVAYYTLDVPFTKWGAHVEARRRAEGVYPPKEIYTPTPDDSQDSFQGYMEDAQRRYVHDTQFPNEPKQMKPGEDFANDNGRVQVSGQVAVMEINGLLCKVIFDHNPTNDFFVEESFPLDWMYPYETPSGIIMKINRNPLPELSDDVFEKDHEFWSKYSERLIGTNVVTYDTSIKDIADFVEKVYLHNNFSGYQGSRKFVRDDDAQKAFSKLRSSQAGMFAWRLSAECPPEYRQKTEAATQALIRETDFAFKQSFAFCPYSPEAVYRYVNFLLQFNRLDDALLVAQTCLKLDPYNDSIKGLIQNLENFQKQAAENIQARVQLQQMEAEAAAHPTNFENIFKLATFYWQIQQTNRANELFDRLLADPGISYEDAANIAQFYAQTANLEKLETALQRLTAIKPAQPEPRYDLAALEAILGDTSAAMQNLQMSLDLSAQRLKTNSAARDLLIEARKDARFNALRNLPEFQKLIPPN
jgi:tetratricopeptide (TPR) repeat protein